MYDLCVELNGSAGSLAAMAEVLGAAGINIEGLSLTAVGPAKVVHCLVDDGSRARRVLELGGVTVQGVSEVFVLDKDQRGITGRPGSFGHICRTLADHGIDIAFAYPAENNRFVFGVEDVGRVHEVLG